MSPEGQAILCLEPDIGGPRHSGGFFYNDCLAAAAGAIQGSPAATQLSYRPRFSVQTWDGGPLPSDFILLDSLWWYVYNRPLDVLSTVLAGRSWGLVMHGLPDDDSGLLGDMVEASFVVVPSFWAASQLASARSTDAASGQLDVRVLYPGWDGRPGLVPGPVRQDNPRTRGQSTVRIASSSNWTPAKGLVEAARVLGRISQDPGCPSWVWQAAGTPDPVLMNEARSCLGPRASRLHTLGHLDSAALIRLLHEADLFLHPSTQETFCLSVFEAALAGCRVVARDLGGVPEALHLARLLRCSLGLPPVGSHLAEASLTGKPPAGTPLEPDQLGKALAAALAAVVAGQTSQASQAGQDRQSLRHVLPSLPGDLLHEFSWQGRLGKLLLGQSDQPLPPISQPQPVEAP